MNTKGQGALEYLLLLAAAVVVVAVVISFLIGTIKPTEDSGNKQTLDFLCTTVKTQNFICGCYLCKGYAGINETVSAKQTAGYNNCNDYYTKTGNTLIRPTTPGGSSTICPNTGNSPYPLT